MNILNVIIILYIFSQIQTNSFNPYVKSKDNCKNNAKLIGPLQNNKLYCLCDEKYSTKPKDNEDRCNYKRKSQLIVFVLEITGFGIGHLYAGNYVNGIFKLIFWIFSFTIFIKMRIAFVKRGDNDEKVISLTFISFILFLIMLIWYIIDLSYIGTGNYLDGNDIELYYWNKKMRFNSY